MTQVTVEQALEIALGHHRAGRWAEAEVIYHQILSQFSDHPDALHLLGILACQSGRMDVAIDLIGRAITINPAVAAYHGNLGECFRRAGQKEAAIASLSRAIELRPDLAEAHNSLGIVLKDQGDLDEAIAACHRAIALKPGYAEAHSNLGNALREQGRFDEAGSAYRRAIELEPGFAEAYNNLGSVFHSQDRLDEAIAAYNRAIALKSDLPEAYNNLGSALKDRGQLDLASAAYRHAIELNPEYAEAHNNLGNVLREFGRLDDAGTAHRKATGLKPVYAEAHNNLGNVLRDQGRLDLAIDSYRRAITLDPGYAEPHNNLGSVLLDQGRLDEAVACFRRAVELTPSYSAAASNLLMSLHCHPAYDAQAILAEHRQWARRYADHLAAQILPHLNTRAPDRTLTIGFLSSDFRAHPVGRLLLPLFAHHDRRQAAFVCYSDVRVADRVTAELEARADRWQSVVGLGDQDLADRIRADRIDILVDLALHTTGNRLLVFARKPAPVQVTMLGLPATTGLSTMDYRLTDRYLDPPGEGDEAYTEQSIRLPHCFWCYEPPEEAPEVGVLPASRDGHVTFGCLNQFAKATRPALQLWLTVLQSVPAARLVIHCQPGSHRDAVHALFAAGGVAGDRVELVPGVSRSEYFQRYQALDLCLDPFPYNGHTSTLDSLWMGVPVITLAGGTAVGRGASLLSNTGLPELIAQTERQYVDIAVQCAGDLPRLAELRQGLRERMRSSALMDTKQFTADVEAAFRRMWQTWCTA